VGRFLSRRIAYALVAVSAGVLLGTLPMAASAAPLAAPASTAGTNRGDVWVDNVGQPPGPGHEMDPHLACADINLWGNGLANSTGTYTVDGWPPSGSKEQDWPQSGPGTWNYDRSAGGDQILDVIKVATLISDAIANGDAVHNKQGFHFKLQFVQAPQKHKTFWVNCPAPAQKQAQIVVQTIDSCRAAIGGATFTLQDSSGATIETQTAAPGGPTTVRTGGGCPIQGGDCVSVPVGCVTFTADIPASGSSTFTLVETATPAGYRPCNGGSACQSESMTIVIDSGGGVQATTTNVEPDGFVEHFPSVDPNTGATFWSGTPADPGLFYDMRLGNVSCDGDNDADDQNTGSPSSHCDNDNDKH